MNNCFKIVIGDLFDAHDVDYICHQVNCRGVMGSGIAKAIADRYPGVKEAYREMCATHAENPNGLLGHILTVKPDPDKPGVINIFGQLDYGRDLSQVYTNYIALKDAFAEINEVYKGCTLAFPHGFACGLAHGDWDTVEKLMVTHLPDCNVQIYFKPHGLFFEVKGGDER